MDPFKAVTEKGGGGELKELCEGRKKKKTGLSINTLNIAPLSLALFAVHLFSSFHALPKVSLSLRV